MHPDTGPRALCTRWSHRDTPATGGQVEEAASGPSPSGAEAACEGAILRGAGGALVGLCAVFRSISKAPAFVLAIKERPSARLSRSPPFGRPGISISKTFSKS